MITVDTSGLFAILNRDDPHHQRVRDAVVADRGPWLIPAATLGEVAYLIEQRLSSDVLNAFIEDLQESRFVLDCGDDDLARVHALVKKYADFPLGFVNAAVIACAERSGGRVLTLDVRHFGVVARDSQIVLLPDPYV